jgi:DEAD/DEAH box helicase
MIGSTGGALQRRGSATSAALTSLHFLTRYLLTRSLAIRSAEAYISRTKPTAPTFAVRRSSGIFVSGFQFDKYRLFSTTVAADASSATNIQSDKISRDEALDEDMLPKFTDLTGLHPVLQRNVATMKFQTMTEIQSKTYEAASSGTDVLGRARTGTGKTVAFLLPSLQRLLSQQLDNQSIHMLVLSPTRELAAQIDDQAQKLGSGSSIRHQVMFGGASKPKDITLLTKHVPTILVATPGRLRDHLQTTNINGRPFEQLLARTKILVLDETDRYGPLAFDARIGTSPPQFDILTRLGFL